MEKILFNNLLIKSNSLQEGCFSGYASVYHEVDSYKDIIVPGAFKECLKLPNNIKLLWQHDAKMPIGIFTKIEETSSGLYVEGQILTTTAKGYEAYELIKNGAIDGLSIGFEILQHYVEGQYRMITECKLWEISIVTFPANDKARIYDIKDGNTKWEKLKYSLNKAIETLESIKPKLYN